MEIYRDVIYSCTSMQRYFRIAKEFERSNLSAMFIHVLVKFLLLIHLTRVMFSRLSVFDDEEGLEYLTNLIKSHHANCIFFFSASTETVKVKYFFVLVSKMRSLKRLHMMILGIFTATPKSWALLLRKNKGSHRMT